MTGKTHAMVGANAVWILPFLGFLDQYTPLFIVVGALAGLLPDIDAKEAEIHDDSLGITKLLFVHKFFGHRKFFHSIVAVILVFLLFDFLLPPIHPALSIVVALGYFSHTFIDGFNAKGVTYFFPWHKMLNLVPRFLQSPVGGWADRLFFTAGTIGLIVFFILYRETFFDALMLAMF